MENLDFLKQEWQLISAAPHIAIGGVIAVCIVIWAFLKWHYSGRIATLKDRAETYKVQKEATQSDVIDLKEQVTAIQNQVLELNQRIKANAQQEALLPISNSTVAAVNQLDIVTGKLEDALKDTDLTPHIMPTPLTMSWYSWQDETLIWSRTPSGLWHGNSSRPRARFTITRDPNNARFVLSEKGLGLGTFASLDEAKLAAKRYCEDRLAERTKKRSS